MRRHNEEEKEEEGGRYQKLLGLYLFATSRMAIAESESVA